MQESLVFLTLKPLKNTFYWHTLIFPDQLSSRCLHGNGHVCPVAGELNRGSESARQEVDYRSEQRERQYAVFLTAGLLSKKWNIPNQGAFSGSKALWTKAKEYIQLIVNAQNDVFGTDLQRGYMSQSQYIDCQELNRLDMWKGIVGRLRKLRQELSCVKLTWTCFIL
jgi:hypothetical protein